MHNTTMFLLFLMLLALTAFFNLAEMALVAARVPKIAASTRGQRAVELKKRPGLFLAAIRAGDLITDLLTGAFVVTWSEQMLQHAFTQIGIRSATATAAANVVAFLLISFVVLVFGDLAPKSVALSAPEMAAGWISYPLQLLIRIARPFFILLEGSNGLVLRLLGVKPEGENRVTEEEIRRTLAHGLHSGALVSFERTLMERVLDLERRSVRTIMTGRPDIQFLRVDMDRAELLAALKTATVSQLLLTGKLGLDEVLGILSRAELLAALMEETSIELVPFTSPITYVSEHTSALRVFEDLKSTTTHMIGVVDEFGSLLGIVTLSDVLEAIAGDVTSDDGSGKEDELPLTQEPDGSYLLAGGYPVDDLVEAHLLPRLDAPSFKTIAGFVLNQLRRLPVQGEVIDQADLRIEVVTVTRGRIETIRLIPRRQASVASASHIIDTH